MALQQTQPSQRRGTFALQMRGSPIEQKSSGEQSMSEPKLRGFALMPKEKLLRIAASGGKVAHRMGLAHKFTTEEAASAGRIGGKSISRNREHMSRIGQAGGKSRAARAKLTAEERRLLQQ
jgi:general stress protein YciG